MNYTFSTLNDKEFEEICRDLLNAKFHLSLQSFGKGKDKGIDLRCSTPSNNNSIIVQVKHYAGSKFSDLKQTLVKSELDKIKKLEPARYIVVTSLSLLPQHKNDLKEALHPFVLSSNDIIGQEDLNSYLSEFKEIEKKYFKLWFSSINILNSILNNAVEGRTRFLLESISNKIKFYVITKRFNEALKILLDKKLVLITGQPGIGKTSLAELLLFERAQNQFKVYCVQSVREAEDVISLDKDEKQIFYFDDFLGANYSEIVTSNQTESQMASFLERIQRTPNKYMILTTRTVILNHATTLYEKINRALTGPLRFEIKLDDYTLLEKAKILYNHLFFKDVPEVLCKSVLNKEFYFTIVRHANYTPRLIDFITSNCDPNIGMDSCQQYVRSKLNNPQEIWKYSFCNQIGYFDQLLLLTLLTFSEDVASAKLERAFKNRLELEAREFNQTIVPDQFIKSIAVLQKGFILTVRDAYDEDDVRIRFVNPSLADFLFGYLKENDPQRKITIQSICYVEQLKRFDRIVSPLLLDLEMQQFIVSQISDFRIEVDLFLYYRKNKKYNNNNVMAKLMYSLCHYCKDVDIDDVILGKFKQLDYSSNWSYIARDMIYVLKNLNNSPKTNFHIQEFFLMIIGKILECVDEYDLAFIIPMLFQIYEHDYDEFCSSSQGCELISNVIWRVTESMEEELKCDNQDDCFALIDIKNKYKSANDKIEELAFELFPELEDSSKYYLHLNEHYWNKVVEKNNEENDDYNEWPDYYDDEEWYLDPHEAIRNLFS